MGGSQEEFALLQSTLYEKQKGSSARTKRGRVLGAERWTVGVHLGQGQVLLKRARTAPVRTALVALQQAPCTKFSTEPKNEQEIDEHKIDRISLDSEAVKPKLCTN